MKEHVKIAFVFWGLAILVLFALCPLQNSENLYRSVIRLHVVANSDSREDQRVKLSVRDSVLSYAKKSFEPSDNVALAKKEVSSHLDEIQKIAEQTLEQEGSSENVSVLLKEEYYPTRNYETLSLPAGDYLSLQIKIGDAEGQNWWCMLFPPMCLESALGPEEALAFAGMEEENVKTVVKEGTGYKIRFKVLEIWSKTKEKIKELF